jgi:P-type Ca2+ transporter type 2C
MTVSSPDQPAVEPWYQLDGGEASRRLTVDPQAGLDHDEVTRRRHEWGLNRLDEPPERPKWLRFLDQFRSGIVYVLIGAAVLAALVGDLKDPIVIAVVLILNAVLGYVQEARADTAMAALKRMLVTRVRVRREGGVHEVDADELVPGDIVLLEAGDRVPADGRLLVAVNTSIDESALTGESVPVDKQVEPLEPGDRPLGDRTNVAFMNTTVVRGRAELLVTETGMHTEMGAIADLLGRSEEEPTPLQKQLQQLGTRLVIIALVAVTAVFVLQVAQGSDVGEAALGAVALAVAAIPEGLPAVVTVTLAVGVGQMAKRGAIVKRLHSVETLGSTTVICSDKTGTLTLNRMTVRDTVADDARRALTVGVLCNDGTIRDGELIGDPTEGALLFAAIEQGIDPGQLRAANPRVDEVPFDSSAKYMATLHEIDGSDDLLLAVKGAPDVVIDRCALSDDERREAVAANTRLAEQGLRVLAVATKTVSADGEGDTRSTGGLDQHIDQLVLDGLFGIVDPPRDEAKRAIELCRHAGIAVKMITGDHASTAGAIADELGIDGRVVTGAELSAMSDDELADQIDGIGVCARVSPEHKVKVVRALKSRGHVVAMTGDGVNDAAALRTADIGVAMGVTGTEVTKDAGDMVLTDDNFATIVGAVERGRAIYDNVITFVRFQLSTNLGAISTILGASLLGLPVLFTPIQVLWVNLIADGPPAMTLGVDPPSRGVMDRPPRPTDAAILDLRRVGHLLFFAAVMAVGTIGLYLAAEPRWGQEVALTMAFTTFVLFQMFNVFNARRPLESVFSHESFSNGRLWGAVGMVVGLQVLLVGWGPMQSVFDTVPLSIGQWLACAAVASAVLWAEEARKLVARLFPSTFRRHTLPASGADRVGEHASQ